MSLKDSEQPFLLHTNFISKSRLKYNIKSIIYSVIYSLGYESVIDILKNDKLDYELYCQMKDKCAYRVD